MLTILFFSTIFFGLGWLIISPILYGNVISSKIKIPNLQQLGIIIISGIVIDYELVLCLVSLKTSLIAGSILSIIGLICFIISFYKSKLSCCLPQFRLVNKILVIVIVCGIYLIPIISKPLIEWDARSIWFFHAKMIYAEGALTKDSGWSHPSVSWSHVDYPKLVPVLAAQITAKHGIWNEYLPKLALFFLLVPAILFLFSFVNCSFDFLFILFFPFTLQSWLWNGYMDGYLALYFFLSLLFSGRYMLLRHKIDFLSSLCCITFLLNLKNEGQLAIVAFTIGHIFIFKSIFFVEVSYRTNLHRIIKQISKSKIWLALTIWSLPFATWAIKKHQWGLYNDLGLTSLSPFARLTTRLSDGSYITIAQKTFEQFSSVLIILVLVNILLSIDKKQITKECLLPLLIGGIYLIGICAIYFIIPYDLTWAMDNSVNRTILSVQACIFVSIFFTLGLFKKNNKLNEIEA